MRRTCASIMLIIVFTGTDVRSAEVATLTEANWDEYVPAGKEVDAIYGDHVLRSDRIVAVVAQAVDTRHANMTVQNVGGSLIDLTRREPQSDQLSCFYPHAGAYKFEGPVDWPEELPSAGGAARLAFTGKPIGRADNATQVVVGYELIDGEDSLIVRTLFKNGSDEASQIKLVDGVRADGEFKFGHEQDLDLGWCHDEYWRGAYGIVPTGEKLRLHTFEVGRPLRIGYTLDEKTSVELPAGRTLVVERRVIPAGSLFDVMTVARAQSGEELTPVELQVTDSRGPVSNAMVRLYADEESFGAARTDDDGMIETSLPPGEYRCVVRAQGRVEKTVTLTVDAEPTTMRIEIPAPGYVEGRIVDESDVGVPCKISFRGKGVTNPNFGPDSAVHGVRNLWHTHDGKFNVELLPGQYDLLISRGPEYDAILRTIDVVQEETTRVEATLKRTVNTTGWISAELHSHSSPSGDNTSSQRGRVLNLLVDHVEFIPCTEHQRISTYRPHLEHFSASHLVLTCAGMELTGSPLPINHQNVFPLIRKPRVQDGGAPVIDVNPEVQIERIAMWDDGSDKVVQINHPNITQMLGDRNLDGSPDQGFRKMFHFADVIEVHPPQTILKPLTADDAGGSGNTIANWMQLLNLGYRLPGVVNTDAHWNFHGSGWLRNYVRSTTDNPAEADLMEVCHALERGQIVMTNGPFMEVKATAGDNTAGPGDDLVPADGEVNLHIRVECPNWLDVNRVQLFINGRPAEEFNFTRRTHADLFGDNVVKFDNTISVKLDTDAHMIVAAAAEGRELGDVYGPEQGKSMPIAVSNPIFVDTAGDGFTPNGDMLGLPLPVEPNHEPTHGHRHTQPRGQIDDRINDIDR